MELVELRARIRAMSRDPETFAAAAGVPPEVIRQVLTGEVRPAPWLVDVMRRTLIPPKRTEPEPEGEA
jgi:hypothetical protein